MDRRVIARFVCADGDILDSDAESFQRFLSHGGSLIQSMYTKFGKYTQLTKLLHLFVRIYVLALAHARLSRDMWAWLIMKPYKVPSLRFILVKTRCL